MIIDTLFVKYLIKCNTNESLLNAVQALSDRGEFTSQYQYALALFGSSSEFSYLRSKIYNQAWKLCYEDEKILIDNNGNEISKVIAFYVLKKGDQKCFNKDMIINEKSINDKIKTKSIENREEYNKKYNELKAKFNNLLMKNRDYYRSYTFWLSYISGQENDKFTIDVENDPYLFNAATKIFSENPLIKVKYDVSKIQFPEYLTLDMMYLIRYQLTAKNLLNFDPYSIKIKNLCSLVYLLYANRVTLKEIEKIQNKMSPNSFAILILVYMNYISEKIPQKIFDSIMSKVDIYDSRNFLLIRILNIVYKKFGYKFENDDKEDFLYIASIKLNVDLKKVTNTRYSYTKRLISKGFFNENENKQLIEANKEDFINFIEKYVYLSKGDRKLTAIIIFQKYSKNDNKKIELIMCLIDKSYYDMAADSLIELTPTTEIINILKDEKIITKIKSLLSNIKIQKAACIFEKFNLKEFIDFGTKIKIFLNFSLSKCKYEINRKRLFEESMNLLIQKDMKKILIRIRYISEKGQDGGGLAKDWFTNVSDEIIKTNAFITTPNGTSLTFNPIYDYQLMYEFIGKFIALTITNKKTIGLKLSSFIWRKIMNEKITLEDMNDYDSEIYRSLKWISENDVNDLMMTFVDSNDEELCENGKNIELTNENKDKFIDLMIVKKLIKPNKEAIFSIIKGFRSIMEIDNIKIFKPEEIKELVNGKESIDIEDWKENTIHNNKEKYDEFFEIISKWSQENLKKLLKFVTGLPIVPFEGFRYWTKYEQSFTLDFTEKSSNRLPISHTCFNKIDIPIYQSKEIFESKLLYAIDCNDFGIA